MFGGLKRLFGRNADSNKRAKSRLHFVLVQDRTGLTTDEMAGFKSEIMAVVEKYFVVDKQAFDVEYKRESDSTVLLINSPVVVKRQESIGGRVGTERQRAAAASKREKEKKEAAAAQSAVKEVSKETKEPVKEIKEKTKETEEKVEETEKEAV